jgi:uncharacterized protein (TIGR02118 family)
MIRLSVLYPAGEGATFDHDYYRESHVPLCVRTWGLAGADIDHGLDGPYVAAVHMQFDSLEQVAEAMAAEGTAAIMADVANYTNSTPVLQTSEVVVL